MKKYLLLLAMAALALNSVRAQEKEEDEDEDSRKGFRKENLFTGGSISLSFGNNSFLVGGSPVFGYRVAKWLEPGLVFNYQYTSFRDVQVFDDKQRQSVYGGGAFVRVFPVSFLFAQANFEHNWLQVKYISPNNGPTYKEKVSANSFLVGAGYSTSRDPQENSFYGYFSVLWDLKEELYSPYTDSRGRAIPIIRAGFNVPLFQGKR